MNCILGRKCAYFSGISSISFKLDATVFRQLTARKMSFSKAEHLYSETSDIRVESCLISLILLIKSGICEPC